jgi:hypothetical protein
MFNRKEDWEAANRDKLKVPNPSVVNNDNDYIRVPDPFENLNLNIDNSNVANLINLKKHINDDNHRFTFFISVPMHGRDDEKIRKDISDAEKYYSGLMDNIGMKYEFKSNFNSTYDKNELTKLYGSKYSKKEDLNRAVRITRLGEAITKMAACDAVIFIKVWDFDDWIETKGCYLEFKVTREYNLNIFHFYTNEPNKKVNNIKSEHRSFFKGAFVDKVGNIGMINDGTYNKLWVIYNISGNTYQLFPMRNLGSHRMNPTDTTEGGYTGTEMYTYIHNTVLPNLKKSGLNITACDLVSASVYKDIVSKTGITSASIAGGEGFWLADPYPGGSNNFYYVYSGGSIYDNSASGSLGVRPLITVVK